MQLKLKGKTTRNCIRLKFQNIIQLNLQKEECYTVQFPLARKRRIIAVKILEGKVIQLKFQLKTSCIHPKLL